jgi:NAD-dependent dihydropyrimidine dehydrogenase PreA subunit
MYYFSGTGNTLHVARELQTRIPGAILTPMVSLLDQEIIAPQAESVGLIFPIYLMTVPIPVRRFVEKLDVSAAEYLFAIATQGGTPNYTSVYLDQMFERQGRRLDAFFTVKMIYNSPLGVMPRRPPIGIPWPIAPSKIEQMQTRVEAALESIPGAIARGETHRAPPLKATWQRTLSALFSSAPVDTSLPYYADDTCTGCGDCERVCASGRVKMVDGKPVWQPDVECYACYACYNYCSIESILVRERYEEKAGRYHYPGIEPEDIAGQKG